RSRRSAALAIRGQRAKARRLAGTPVVRRHGVRLYPTLGATSGRRRFESLRVAEESCRSMSGSRGAWIRLRAAAAGDVLSSFCGRSNAAPWRVGYGSGARGEPVLARPAAIWDTSLEYMCLLRPEPEARRP